MSREDWPDNSTQYCETLTHGPPRLSLDTVRRVYPQVRARQNEAIRERYGEGASCRTIAHETGLSVRTVQRIIYGSPRYRY
jgi:DNA-directed RNA polymerase specialized sigma24 family protein